MALKHEFQLSKEGLPLPGPSSATSTLPVESPEMIAASLVPAIFTVSKWVVPSAEEQATMLQPEDCGRTIAFVASMPPRVCMNEILISPTHNRGFIQTPASRD